jgi:tetratricopeptide (TPR) repeat protein
VLPRGVAYRGRIHEQPASALPRRRLELVVGHDGYRDANKAKKAGRNEKLLHLALAETPDDPYLHYQLAKDRELRALFASALPHYERAIADAPADAAWRHDLVVRTLFTLKKVGAFEAALALAERELPRWQGSPDFFFTVGDVLLDFALAAPNDAGALLPMIESSWLRAMAIGERPELHDTVRGRGSFLAAHNLAALHESLGDADQARHWREQALALGLPEALATRAAVR